MTVPGADLETESTTHPKIDYSLLRANNPFLSRTVKPHTKVEGAGWDGLTGTISPHPTYRVVPVNPIRFIRTTCDRARLPPGIYSFLKENTTAPLRWFGSSSWIFFGPACPLSILTTSKWDILKILPFLSVWIISYAFSNFFRNTLMSSLTDFFLT